ncbi:MAG TPA: serine/threonine-protein kinase [Halomicronema sp.]
MLYCSNIKCPNPFNPDGNKFCLSCGTGNLSTLFRNRYHVINLLGEGGFSRTYYALDADRMNDPCVIKQFVPQLQGTSALEKASELFRQEAKRLYELGEHSQIPHLLAYFEQDNRLYLVQELIEGQTLLEELETEGNFSEEKIRQILTDLLPVLKIVHESNVIHRDIKPENIMRRQRDGKLMLIDFGVSKQVTATILGQIGTTVGTPGYVPLEQMRGQVFPASDLYSLGVTCIRLLTGCLPNENDNLYDGINGRWLWREKLPNSTEINANLGTILDKLVEDYVKDRYQSAQEVLEALNSSNLTKKSHSTNVDNFISAVGIDYRELQDLLSEGKWQQADQKTADLMLEIAEREQEGYLYPEDIEDFPCEDLQIIDKLWVKYSNGRFGFSVQKIIWEKLGEITTAENYDLDTWFTFAECVGWKTEKTDWFLFFEIGTTSEWKNYYELIFSEDKAPKGHLPCLGEPSLRAIELLSIFIKLQACLNN